MSEGGKWEGGRSCMLLLKDRWSLLSRVRGRRSGMSLIWLLRKHRSSQLRGMFVTVTVVILFLSKFNSFISLNCLYRVKFGIKVNLFSDKSAFSTLTSAPSLCSSVSSSVSVRFLNTTNVVMSDDWGLCTEGQYWYELCLKLQKPKQC